ncbi:MAG: aminopeptidase P family protein [Candidatus Omnitrophota bacterium]
MNFRLNAIHSKTDELGLDGLLISKEVNVNYLSNFKSDDSYLLFDKKEALFLTDFRNYQEAKKYVKNLNVVQITDSFFQTVAQLLKKRKIKKLGFEAKGMDFATYVQLRKRLGKTPKLVATYDIVEDMRQIKTKEEIALIRKAVNITLEAFRFAKRILKPNLTENNFISKIERFVRDKGAEGFSFAPIAASGKNSSYPHAKSSNKKIGNNTSVTLDLGVSYRGYKTDLTRVFFLGRIPTELLNIYNIVCTCQRQSIAKIKLGICAAQIDKEARTLIAEKGFGRFFKHSTGHGIGLEVHEKPFISKRSIQTIAAGMVFTIEPAIYLPNRFGVRIEDMVLVKDNGCEVLSGALDK